MLARDVMTRSVATCRADQTASEAARAMWDRDCGVVPVLEGGRLRGVVTDRDLLMAAQIQGTDLRELKLSAMVQSPAATCREEDSVESVLDVMAARQIRRVPVVDREDRLVGIVSLNDVVLHMGTDDRQMRKVAKTLAAICRHREPAAAL